MYVLTWHFDILFFNFCIYTAPAEQTLEHADDVEQLKKLRQLGGEGIY